MSDTKDVNHRRRPQRDPGGREPRRARAMLKDATPGEVILRTLLDVVRAGDCWVQAVRTAVSTLQSRANGVRGQREAVQSLPEWQRDIVGCRLSVLEEACLGFAEALDAFLVDAAPDTDSFPPDVLLVGAAPDTDSFPPDVLLVGAASLIVPLELELAIARANIELTIEKMEDSHGRYVH